MATDASTETENIASGAFYAGEPAIAILTTEPAVVSWNAHAEKITGYDLPALNAVGVAQIFEPLDILPQMVQKAGAGLATARQRVQLRKANGRLMPVEVQCSPLLSLDSDVRLVVVMRAVAPVYEDSLKARLNLSHLAASLSHDIRNPLNSVFLHMDIIEEELRLPTPGSRGQVEQSLSTIKAEVTRLHDLMQDYLSLARLANMPREPEDLSALIEALVQEMQAELVARGVSLALEGLDELGEVALHKSLFRRTLRNILQRLVEAIPRGGTLTLRAGRQASHFYLSICDLGKAIPSDSWEVFLSSIQATNPEGIDLGIYVAREIISAHGGEVAVTHEPGRGMMCTVTLPLSATT
jgi:PAS domain S-box-containing protein